PTLRPTGDQSPTTGGSGGRYRRANAVRPRGRGRTSHKASHAYPLPPPPLGSASPSGGTFPHASHGGLIRKKKRPRPETGAFTGTRYLLLVEVAERLVEAAGGTTTLAAAVATVATLGTGLATVTTTAIAATVTTVATATTVSAASTVTTATATVAAVATILTTRGRRLGIGKRGTGKGVDELEAHLAPVDLTDPHL